MSNTLAVKALNQYRKRDIFPYLGLRYYLNSTAGRKNEWINNICIRLSTNTKKESYLRTYHFKGINGKAFEHREIYLPSPNEILAETALITEISKHAAFNPKPYVYSYRYAREDDKSGVFQAYFDGFKERHRHIANACWKAENGVVLYTDIKKFYPSIRSIDALSAWERACEKSKIEETYRNLGREILSRHNATCTRDGSGKGLLTGPLISHVIANLLLDDIDVTMHKITNGNYWRYVDDVIFVGRREDTMRWRDILEEKFGELDLSLHDGEKDFQVPCGDWLEGEHDFNDSFGLPWISLIADVKRFLLANPSKISELQKSFRDNHIRIPVVDYSNSAKESTFLQRFQDWRRKYKWTAKKVRSISIKNLLEQAMLCEIEFTQTFDKLLINNHHASAYETKRLTPKLRYLAGRLLYLSSRDKLAKLANKLESFPDLFLLAKTMEAVSSLDMSNVVRMGANATHIAAQLIRVDKKEVTIDDTIEYSPVVEQSLAALELNGINHNFKELKSDLRSFAKAENIANLMNSKEVFIKELACLHGLLASRHQETLDSSFDRDEELALDVLNQLQNSSHC